MKSKQSNIHKIGLPKPKITSLQRIILMTLGVLLCVFLLEVSLRIGGFLIMSLQEHRNHLSMKNKNTYRIMCLGESTTVGQYPSFLEEILNNCNAGIKFSVIDKGVGGTKTMFILSQLESNLDEYKPDMVITMMGINDFGPHMPCEATSASRLMLFLRSFRTYKLIRIAWLHIVTKAKELGFDNSKGNNEPLNKFKLNPITEELREINAEQTDSNQENEALKKEIALNPADDQAYLALGYFYQGQDKFSLAAEFYNKAIELNPKNDSAYAGLGWCYQSQVKLSQAIESFNKAIELNPKNDSAYVGLGSFYLIQGIFFKAEEFYNKAIELNPKNDSAYAGLGWCYHSKGEFSQAAELFRKAIRFNAKNHWGLIGLGSSCQWLGEFSEAVESFDKAIELNPKDVWGYIGLGTCYLKQKKYLQAEEVFKRAIDACPGDSKPYGLLSILYKEIGRNRAAEEYSRKANAVRSEYYEPMTINNYRKIKTILDRRGIQLVCVEYPMCSVEPLKKIFEGQKGIIFVDNENIFKKAVNKDSYRGYFTDMFGGDFGHCTNKGNRLLADNIANVILKELFGNKINTKVPSY